MTSKSNLFDLSGKIAVVTGGTGILGETFCSELKKYGAKVISVDINKKADINCDVSNPDSVNNMVNQVIQEAGSIDILINNAASKSENLDSFFAPFEEYNLDEWRKIMSVNLDGAFLVAQAVGKQMIKQGRGGSIIQIGSIYGEMAPDQRIYEGSLYMDRQINSPAVYTTSKAGIIGLTKYLAAYWAEHNIRVNTVSPGGVESGQNDAFKKKYSERVPMNRMAQKEDIAGTVVFLASDASKYITGQNIMVDGGLSCW